MTHEGPNYLRIKETGITADSSSYTEDRLRGVAPTNGFKRIDRFNQHHFVKVSSSNPQVTIMFPVSNREVRFRASGIDNPGDELRTGCGAEHRWCEATFLYQKSGPQFWGGEHVWGKFTFYEDNDISSKCTDWNRWERALDTAQKGVSLAQSVKSLGGY
ncbi:Hypothetical predicted protein [Paramuricea clavata]|uniref:Uncharacterized protein n=1 Tax=Paramuricea clavata TaxID=317549 RepID=A0A7D9L0M1_PARCT|nr:Hypothetical predicted protein [Paramuricea clavata]